MTYYDRYGRRIPTPRQDATSNINSNVVMAVVAMIIVAGFAVWAYMSQCAIADASKDAKEANRIMTHDSMTAVHTYDGETIRFYVMTDPDTNVQYIVNDRGGMCVREQRDAL